jgi:transposase-like protein
MLQIHPSARTTPTVRAEIAASQEPTGILAKRYGISTETVRKWRKRGPDDCLENLRLQSQLQSQAEELAIAEHFPV